MSSQNRWDFNSFITPLVLHTPPGVIRVCPASPCPSWWKESRWPCPHTKRPWAAIELRPQRSLESRLCCRRVNTPQRQRLDPQGLLTSNSSKQSQLWSTPYPHPPPHLLHPLLPGLWSTQVLQRLHPHTDGRLQAATNTTCHWTLRWTTLTVPPSSDTRLSSLDHRLYADMFVCVCRYAAAEGGLKTLQNSASNQGGAWPVPVNRTRLELVWRNQPNTQMLRVKGRSKSHWPSQSFHPRVEIDMYIHAYIFTWILTLVCTPEVWSTAWKKNTQASRNESVLQAEKVCNLILEASVINRLCCFAYISPNMFTKVHESHPGRFMITSNFVYRYFYYFKVISYFINHLFHAPLYSLALTHLIEAEGMRSFKDSF